MFKHFPSSFAWFGAIFAAIGTMCFVIGAYTFYMNWEFSRSDVAHVTGTVTKLYTTTSHSRHGSSTSYHVAYDYVDSNGIPWGDDTTVVWGTYISRRIGNSIPVKFLPESPGTDRVDLPAEDSNHQTTAWIMLAMGLFFGGFGWWIFISLERLILFRRWLRRHGVPCAGTVKSVEVNSSVQVNHRSVRYLTYTYADSLGREHLDSTQALSHKQEELWTAGDSIEVYYDPRDPNRSTAILDKKAS